MLIERVLGSRAEMDRGKCAVERVFLSSEEVLKPHQRVRTEAGRELKISLSRGEQLFCGAVLFMDEQVLIAVDMPEEKAFELRPRTHWEWARAAYHIGNMHQSAFLYEDCIRLPYDDVLERTIDALEIEYSVKQCKLDGVRAGAAGGGHEHSHSGALD